MGWAMSAGPCRLGRVGWAFLQLSLVVQIGLRDFNVPNALGIFSCTSCLYLVIKVMFDY